MLWRGLNRKPTVPIELPLTHFRVSKLASVWKLVWFTSQCSHPIHRHEAALRHHVPAPHTSELGNKQWQQHIFIRFSPLFDLTVFSLLILFLSFLLSPRFPRDIPLQSCTNALHIPSTRTTHRNISDFTIITTLRDLYKQQISLNSSWSFI
jgi:hypothetical protein